MYQRERERCEIFAEYLVENTHLPWVNPALYQLAKRVLEVNKSERHLRGGEATRRKYQRKRKAV